ncbi:MAG: hypothetical protein VB084_14830, partial [Syntrophomonadaceae bacterium]|nr:hypothetical protein [Syntrophomonadaceae bacterium]
PINMIDPLGHDANFDLNDLSDFYGLIEKRKKQAEAQAHLNQMAAQFGLNTSFYTNANWGNTNDSTLGIGAGSVESTGSNRFGVNAYSPNMLDLLYHGGQGTALKKAFTDPNTKDAIIKTGFAVITVVSVAIGGSLAVGAAAGYSGEIVVVGRAVYTQGAVFVYSNALEITRATEVVLDVMFDDGTCDTFYGFMVDVGKQVYQLMQ